MYFIIEHNKTEINKNTELSLDWKLFEIEKRSIYIYGYPFHCRLKRWVHPKDINEWIQNDNFDFLSEIDGIYTILILGLKNYVITDRYGVYTLFYKKTNNSIIISDSIHKILDCSLNYELNNDSVYEFLNFGFKIGNKTLIKDIYEFEGAFIYSFTNDLIIKSEKYWNIFDNQDLMSKEKFRLCFNKRVKLASKLESAISLPLTGGLDTRNILSSCITFKEQLHCYTHGETDIEDRLLAKIICNHFEIEHSARSWDINWIKKIPKLLEQNALMFNGNNGLFYIHVIESLKKESKNQKLFLSGVLGNQLFRHHPIGNTLPVFNNIDEIPSFILERIPSVFNFRTDLSSYYNKLFIQDSCSKILTTIRNNVRSDIETAVD